MSRLYDHQYPRIRSLGCLSLQHNTESRARHTCTHTDASTVAGSIKPKRTLCSFSILPATLDWTSAQSAGFVVCKTIAPVESPPSISEAWISSPNSGIGSLPVECRNRKHRLPRELFLTLVRYFCMSALTCAHQHIKSTQCSL